MIKNILKQKALFISSIVLFVLFILITILVATLDKGEAGESLAQVGLSSINSNIFDTLGKNDVLDKITDVLLILSFLVVLLNASLGAFFLIKNKKLDLSLVILGCFYILCLILYVLFNHIHINYAPLLDEGEFKESFPSSHVLASVFIFLSSIIVINQNINKRIIKNILLITTIVLSLLMVVFRLLSGWHWFTDILAGELLGLFLVSLYALITLALEKRFIEIKKENKKDNNDEELH